MMRVLRILACLLSCALGAGPAGAQAIEGRVIETSDGATLSILQGRSIYQVRLAGIIAPAVDTAIGRRSRQGLQRVASGRTARVEAGGVDDAGTLLGTVLIVHATAKCAQPPCETYLDPAESQLSAGYATLDEGNLGFRTDAQQARYRNAQASARSRRLGLWRPVSPVVRTETDYNSSGGVYPLRPSEPVPGKR